MHGSINTWNDYILVLDGYSQRLGLQQYLHHHRGTVVFMSDGYSQRLGFQQYLHHHRDCDFFLPKREQRNQRLRRQYGLYCQRGTVVVHLPQPQHCNQWFGCQYGLYRYGNPELFMPKSQHQNQRHWG